MPRYAMPNGCLLSLAAKLVRLLRFQEAEAEAEAGAGAGVSGATCPSLLVPSLSASRKYERERSTSSHHTFLEQTQAFEVRSLQHLLGHSWQSCALLAAMATKSLRSFRPLNRGLQNATTRHLARIPRRVNMSTIASFKIPKVSNEPNVSRMCQLIDEMLIRS
jgi:hypothetical protein